jgi:hypothetical protein
VGSIARHRIVTASAMVRRALVVRAVSQCVEQTQSGDLAGDDVNRSD